MQLIVNELSIEAAVRRARARFEQADGQLARALADADAALPWVVLGAVAMAAGFLGLSALLPLPADATPFMAATLALGGAFVGYGIPVWLRALGRHRRSLREWHDALDMLRLREQQAKDDPELTVEVLDGLQRHRPAGIAAWKTGMTAAAGRYVQ